MAENARRLDQIEKVVADDNRRIDDVASTVLSRLASHTHTEAQVTSLVADLAGKAPLSHTHEPTDITAATLHEYRVVQNSSQTVSNSTDTKMTFNTVTINSADVTAAGSTDFTINRSGLWHIAASVRFAGAAGGGERHMTISTGTSLATLSNRLAGQSSGSGTFPFSLNVSTVTRLTAASTIIIGLWQSSGGSLATDVGFGDSNHLVLTWLRP